LRTLGDLAQLDILDVGCGTGQHLRWLLEQGASTERLHGIDALPSRVERSTAMNPAIDVRLAGAEALPFADSSFDVVTQFTAFSSMDRGLRVGAASEICRVSRPGATLVWYDVRRPAHIVPDGLPLDDVAALFPDFEVLSKQSMCSRLLPVAARWEVAAALVELLPVARTNLLVVLRDQRERRA
jgi:ubiquinone/menaquinone biosynthesis C-methylase UbiE